MSNETNYARGSLDVEANITSLQKSKFAPGLNKREYIYEKSIVKFTRSNKLSQSSQRKR